MLLCPRCFGSSVCALLVSSELFFPAKELQGFTFPCCLVEFVAISGLPAAAFGMHLNFKPAWSVSCNLILATSIGLMTITRLCVTVTDLQVVTQDIS